MHVGDSNSLNALLLKFFCNSPNAFFIQRNLHLPYDINPFIDGEAELTRDQWLRLLNEHVVLVEPTFIGNLQRIAKAFRRNQCGLRTFTLDNRIGCECRAMNDLCQITKTDTCIAQNNLGPFDQSTLWCIR